MIEIGTTVVVKRTGRAQRVTETFDGRSERKADDYVRLEDGTLYWDHELVTAAEQTG